MVDATTLARSIINKHPEIEAKKLTGNRVELITPPEMIYNVVAMIDQLVPDAFPESSFGVDLEDDKYELIYIFWSHESRMLCQIRVRLNGEEPEIQSVCDIFPGLEWHERETSEMFGIRFKNHPDMRPLLLPDELAGKYPLRKRFKTDRSRLEETGLAASPRKMESGEGSS